MSKSLTENKKKVLEAVKENPKKRVGFYVEKTKFNGSQFTKISDSLVRKGFIKRVRSKTDRRATVLSTKEV